MNTCNASDDASGADACGGYREGMKRRLLIGVLLVGCSGGGVGTGTTGDAGPGDAATQPVQCDRADRVGTYWVEATVLTGDCGPYTAGLEQATLELDPACTFDSPDVWRDNDCTLERAITCTEGDFVRSGVAVSSSNADGSVLTGTVTFEISDLSGNYVCYGSYETTAVRR